MPPSRRPMARTLKRPSIRVKSVATPGGALHLHHTLSVAPAQEFGHGHRRFLSHYDEVTRKPVPNGQDALRRSATMAGISSSRSSLLHSFHHGRGAGSTGSRTFPKKRCAPEPRRDPEIASVVYLTFSSGNASSRLRSERLTHSGCAKHSPPTPAHCRITGRSAIIPA